MSTASMDVVIAIRQLAKAAETYGPNSVEFLNVVTQQRQSLAAASRMHDKKAFIVLPSQLDTTQPEAFGYGSAEWKIAHKARPTSRRLYKRDFGNALSNGYNLCPDVLAKSVLFNTHSKENFSNTKILSEFSKRQGRRCCFVKSNGMRCTQYNATGAPVCPYHLNLVESIPRMNDRFLSVIKNEPMRLAFEKHLKDPNRKSMEGELALMRTMLDAMISRIEIGTDLNKIPVELLASIMVMCEKITGTVDKMAAMETKLGMRLSLDQVMAIVYNVVDLVFKTCPNLEQQQLTAIADGIETLPILKRQTNESVQASKGYGCDIAEEEGVTHSTPLDKYEDDGKVIRNGFTDEEVKSHRAVISKKFEPASAEYAERTKEISSLNPEKRPGKNPY